MGLPDLQGKRTGRHKGGKNRPTWLQDLHWAYKNVGKPNAMASSEGARYWLGVARERPSEFAAALAQLDRADNRKTEGDFLTLQPPARTVLG
jgi:hypothetical protein